MVMSLILAPIMGALGIWIAQIAAGLFPAAAILIYTVTVSRKFPRSIEDKLVLREDFGVPEEDRIDISIKTEDDIFATSEKVMNFCTERGLDFRRSFYSGLCIEEMAGNIVGHGFVYASDPELSRFADSHESGRLYVDQMTGDNVLTSRDIIRQLYF